jgi:exoribonuclease II
MHVYNNVVTCISIARQPLGKHIPAQAYARNNRTLIARPRISKHTSLTIQAAFSVGSVQTGYKEVFSSIEQWLSEAERVQFKKSSFETVVQNLVQFCRWHSKAIQKKWQERIWAVQRRLHV